MKTNTSIWQISNMRFTKKEALQIMAPEIKTGHTARSFWQLAVDHPETILELMEVQDATTTILRKDVI